MSEYQFVHFLAIDRPLDDKQLAFMERQSTRAEITRWEFTNEYHYGDFHGNAMEMLRRGYDVHLHYANFGIRRLMIRLPAGLPCDQKTFRAFKAEYGLAWHADKKGKGGILEIYPEADAGTYEEAARIGGAARSSRSESRAGTSQGRGRETPPRKPAAPLPHLSAAERGFVGLSGKTLKVAKVSPGFDLVAKGLTLQRNEQGDRS